jgi:hypothetical protein
MAAVKLDENLSGAALVLTRQAGHDAESISSQRMNGSADVTVF